MSDSPEGITHEHLATMGAELLSAVQSSAICECTIQVLDKLLDGTEAVLAAAGLPVRADDGCTGPDPSPARLIACRVVGIADSIRSDGLQGQGLTEIDREIVEHMLAGAQCVIEDAAWQDGILSYNAETGALSVAQFARTRRSKRPWP